MYSSQARESCGDADKMNGDEAAAGHERNARREEARAERKLNHFDYFTEVEDYFLQRRAKTLLLSPMDWALIESWKQKGVPLHVALRGIERAFDSFERRPPSARRRSIKTLLYCAEEVEAQHAEWLESQTGAVPAATEDGTREEAKQTADDPVFSPTAIRAHLADRRESLAGLREASEHNPFTLSPAFRESLARVESRLDELMRDWESAVNPSAERLEDALTQLETLLDEHLHSCFTPAQLKEEERLARGQLAAYKSRMEPATYQHTFTHLLMKSLRERLGVPRLSLFYL